MARGRVADGFVAFWAFAMVFYPAVGLLWTAVLGSYALLPVLVTTGVGAAVFAVSHHRREASLALLGEFLVTVVALWTVAVVLLGSITYALGVDVASLPTLLIAVVFLANYPLAYLLTYVTETVHVGLRATGSTEGGR